MNFESKKIVVDLNIRKKSIELWTALKYIKLENPSLLTHYPTIIKSVVDNDDDIYVNCYINIPIPLVPDKPIKLALMYII